MTRTLGVAFAALLGARSAVALRFSQESAGAAADVPLSVEDRKKRQVMYNYLDAQYFCFFDVGGQEISGLLDTGSFDLVVFDQSCTACGKASRYGSIWSDTYKAAPLTQTLYYGSGSVDAQQAFDLVSVGPYDQVNLSFWNGVDAAMPVLQTAAFNAVIGVGPPETPGADAWGLVMNDVKSLEADIENGPRWPSNFTYAQLQQNTDLATELSANPTLIKANDVTRFSVCLGKKLGSVGYFTWNDTSYEESPNLFSTVKVLGKHTWTVNMTDIQLSSSAGNVAFGCEQGCGAIVDSGTSLLLMPYAAITALRDHLRRTGVDCNDVSALPDLSFKLGGMEFTLPPEAYIAKMTGSAGANMAAFAAQRVPLGLGPGNCELAVMGSSTLTNWGPLWILGMPFFRRYYTTFQVGRSHSDRMLHITPASSNCTPMAMQDVLARGAHSEHRGQQELRVLNRSHILIPRIVHKAMSHSYLGDL